MKKREGYGEISEGLSLQALSMPNLERSIANYPIHKVHRPRWALWLMFGGAASIHHGLRSSKLGIGTAHPLYAQGWCSHSSVGL